MCQLQFTNNKPEIALTVLNVLLMNQESLPEYVRRVINEKGLTFRQVEERSKSGESKVTGAYVNKIVNSIVFDVTTLSIDKIQALARGLGEPEETVFSIIRGVKPNKEVVIDKQFENLSLKFSGLPPTRKERLQSLIEMMDREIERAAHEK